MDNNTYILTSDGELYHYGVPGMKWGVRRTPAQLGHAPSAKKKRVGKAKSIIEKLRAKSQAKKDADHRRKEDLKNRTKKVSEMSDDELRQYLNRVKMEREAYQISDDISRLRPQKVSAGKKFINDFRDKALGPAAIDAGRKLLNNLMDKAIDKALGDAKDPLAALKKEAEKAGYDKIISEAKKAATDAAEKEYNLNQRRERDKAKAAADQADANEAARKANEQRSQKEYEKSNSTYSRSYTQDSKAREGEVVDRKSRAFISSPQKSKNIVDDPVSAESYAASNRRQSGWEYTARNMSSEISFDSPSTRSHASSGQQYLESRNVAGLLSSPIAGYLPAPKDDD